MTPGGGKQYFDLIDPLRGFAAVSVLAYHVIENTHWRDFPESCGLFWFKWGWMGTDIFFVISGFVITLSALNILAKNNGDHKKSIMEFAARRARRIVPLHYLTLLFFSIAMLRPFLDPEFLKNLAAHLLFIHNFFPEYHRTINAPNWTLGIEVQFYVLLILVIPCVNYRNLKYFVTGAFGVAFLWRAASFYLAPEKNFADYVFMGATQLPGMLDFFACGMLAAFFTKSRYFQTLKASLFLKFCLFAIIVLWWAVSFPIFEARASDYWLNASSVIFPRSLLAILFTLLVLLLCAFNLAAGVKKILAPLVYLGTISYGIYLFHWPLVLLLEHSRLAPVWKLALTLAGSIIAASLSWHFFEKRFLRQKQRPTLEKDHLHSKFVPNGKRIKLSLMPALRKCLGFGKAVWATQGGKCLLLIGLPAILALFKYAHTGLNADIILNQIMALHNPTLFYWGQNRIFNIMPFLLSCIKWPMLNLFLVLLFGTASFFCLIYSISLLAVKINKGKVNYQLVHIIYIFNISICVFLFKPQGWIEICLWHFEYSFPLLLLCVNLYCYFFKQFWPGCLSLPLAFVALGVNPSLILVFGFIVVFYCFSKWRITGSDIFIFIFYAVAFCFWLWLSRQYGSFADYSTLILAKYNEGVEKLIINFTESYMKMGNLLLVVGSMAGGAIITKKFAPNTSCLTGQISLFYLFSAIMLTLFIACIRWYHMNDFSPRYFIFLVYGAIFVFSYWLMQFMAIHELFYKFSFLLSAMFFILCIYFFYPPSFNLQKCQIYQKCNENVPVGANLYAGDYWQAWACMSRDINNGHDSYALVYRSDPDRENIINKIKMLQDSSQKITVWCLKSDYNVCEKQLKKHLPDYTLDGNEKINQETVKLDLKDVRIAP